MNKNQEASFSKIVLSGAGIIKEIDGENTLVIVNTVEKAIEIGIDEKHANEFLVPKLNPCTVEFGWFGTVECGNQNKCNKTCVLKYYEFSLKEWVSIGESKSVAGNRLWKCFCE